MLFQDVTPILQPNHLSRLRAVADVLLPGDGNSPAALSLKDLDEWLVRAFIAIGQERTALVQALGQLPLDLNWDGLKQFDATYPAEFEIISAVAAGAYFMSPTVLDSISYPHGPRRAPSSDQIVDELETGVLDKVMERESMVRGIPA